MPVTDPSRAVFLSYALQDAGAAQWICEALRAAGIEVWFDQSELRGGDAWDQKIRREIRDCALFVPVISANTAARHEGYFRLEWDLADQRTHMIARNRAFIVPVCVDATPETSSDTPESFQRVQWTRLPGGETSPAFVERVRRLLLPESASASEIARSAGSALATDAPAPRGLIRPRTGALYGAIAAALVLALGYFGLERLIRPMPSVRGAASIAVLPLANESGEASQQYFSDGISEDLITALTQFPGLKVIGRSSAFQFRDSKEDSRSIGAKLGVAHLLEGSVRRSGEVVRVSAELVDTADGSTQWSERYDRPYKDLFALQDEITRAVAGALRAKLLPGEHTAAQSERPPGGSLEAYNALLQGRFYIWHQTEVDVRKAIESYTQATQLDPRYALAWSRLAGAWTELGAEYLEGAPAEEAYARARAAADRALALSPELAAAHVARGYLLLNADFDWRGAEAEYRRAMELAPNDGEAKFYFGKQLATFGEVERAIELTRQALATEPVRANWYNWLATYLRGLDRLDEAERAIRKAIELQPTAESYHYTLSIIEIQRGNAPAALAAAQQEPPGGWQDEALALARQIGGDRSAADAALRTLVEKDANSAAYQIAEVYALRNDAKATFEWLDRAWSNRDGGIQFLLYDPFILRYKDDPRFAAYCRKVGLPVPGEAPARKSA
jgi:TolB-like protein/Tfp pilus assembly protein PilF